MSLFFIGRDAVVWSSNPAERPGGVEIKYGEATIDASNEKVDVSGKKVTSISFKNLDNARIRELDLNNNKLTSLPVEIGRLTGLTYLDLDGNQLTSLPVEIGMLTGLGGDGAMGWAWTTTLSSHRPLRCAIEASPPSAPTFSSTRLNPASKRRRRRSISWPCNRALTFGN